MRTLAALGCAALLAGCADGKDSSLARAEPEEAAAAEASATEASTAEASASAELVLPPPGTPVVDLAGVTTLPAPIPEGAARLAATSWVTTVFQKPDREGKTLGVLRAGAIVEAADGETLKASKKCSKGWRAIKPAGFVCVNDVTEDLADPIVRAVSRRADPAHRLPYMYGTVTRGGPAYGRLPTKKQLKKLEPGLKTHLDKWKRDKESGAEYGLDVWLRYMTRPVPTALEALENEVSDPEIPWFLVGGSAAPNLSGLIDNPDDVKIDQVERRQGRSFIESFLHEGRRYNVTPDLVVIPADRFRPIRGSSFHGWQVDKELKFPFALVRRAGGKKWKWVKKRMVEDGDLPWRTALLLTGKQQMWDGKLHYETTEGFWVDDRHAGRVDPAKKWPKWAKQGGKWIDINLTKQILVAYEGQTMVYATLISSGEAGLEDPETSTATTRGIFRIHNKLVATTMDSDVVGEEFELRDVPYVQYFEGGYAIHGAYWHDGFGRPKSHGCINLAPEDARRLFYWTDPPVPAGWHGAETALNGTIIFVHQ